MRWNRRLVRGCAGRGDGNSEGEPFLGIKVVLLFMMEDLGDELFLTEKK